MELLQAYVDHLPHYLLSWKLYGVALLCLALEFLFFVRVRPLLSVGLAQDFVFGALNRWLFVPFLLVSTAVYQEFYAFILPPGDWQIALDWSLGAQMVVGFVAADFMVYVSHWMLHRFGLLWHFHAMHHSQRNLNPLTAHRTHIVQDVFQDVVQYLPLALLGVGYPTWVGVRALNWFWSHLIHANVRWNLGPVGRVLVSPQYHRLHHSIDPEHHDRNLANRLVLWDQLFGTYHPDRETYAETGIPDASYPHETSARPAALLRQAAEQYIYPFRMIVRDQREAAGVRIRR